MKQPSLNKITMTLVTFTLIYFLVSMLQGCKAETQTVATTTTTMLKAQKPLVALSWENNKAERLEWSEYVYKLIAGELFNSLDVAQDTERLCKKYKTLTLEQRATVLSELISIMAYYESSWNPKSASVDVGKPDQKDTWSVGLMQVSVTDQWGDVKLGYKYDDLLQAKPNLHLALKILERQVKKTGKIILPNTDKMRYWAVLLDGNKYSKVSQITAKTQALPFCK